MDGLAAESGSGPERLPVALGARAYDILVGEGLLAAAGRHVAPLLKRPRAVVVTDETVARLHLPTLVAGLGFALRPLSRPPARVLRSAE